MYLLCNKEYKRSKEKAFNYIREQMHDSAFLGFTQWNVTRLNEIYPLAWKDLKCFAEENDLVYKEHKNGFMRSLDWSTATKGFGKQLLEETILPEIQRESLINTIVSEINKQTEEYSLEKPVVRLKLIDLARYMTVFRAERIVDFLKQERFIVTNPNWKQDEEYTIFITL